MVFSGMPINALYLSMESIIITNMGSIIFMKGAVTGQSLLLSPFYISFLISTMRSVLLSLFYR